MITNELLRYVRDQTPTVDEFLDRFGGPHGSVYHTLRKQQVLIIEDERVRLDRRCLAPDGSHFVWGNLMYMLDSEVHPEEQRTVCRVETPVYAEDP